MSEANVLEYREGRFYLDAYPSLILRGYTQGLSWNGWAVPEFEFEEARRIAETINANKFDESMHYDAEKDVFLYVDNEWNEAEVTYEGYDIVVNGEVKHVYGIGTSEWTWREKE